MPKRLDRDQEPKEEGGKDGKKGKVTCWTRQQKKMEDEQDKNKRQKPKGESEDDSGDKERKDRQMHREMVWKKNRKRSESL